MGAARVIAATLFSGIGAPECAMPEWDWRWHAEIEKFPSAVMAARHPTSINLGDVNAKDFVERAERIGRPDVLVFGSPCQDFSVAGQRVGLDGHRGNLALVALGIVAKLRPRWVVFENVPGLLSSYSGSADAERSLKDAAARGRAEESDAREDSDFAAFLTAVSECGYLGCYRITDAQFAGVPQRRRRLFAVFHLGDWRPAAAVLFEPESLRGDYPPSRPAGESTTQPIAPSLTGSGRGIDRVGDTRGQDPVVAVISGAVSSKWSKGTGGPAGDECYNLVLAFDETQITNADNRCQPQTGEPCHPLAATARPPAIAFSCKDNGRDATTEQSPTLRAMNFDGSHANAGGQIAVAIPILEAGARTGRVGHEDKDGIGVGAAGDPMFSLQASKHHAVAFQTRVARNGRGTESEVVPALNGADAGATSDMRPCVAVFKPSHFTRGKDGAPSDVTPPLGAEPDKGDQDPILLTESAVRRLTPRECERLQDYADDYTLVKYRGKPAADGPRYKALGNSMCVAEIGWVLKRIDQFERQR
jgi:DNA (cytosine-5)-methyltransferase 1